MHFKRRGIFSLLIIVLVTQVVQAQYRITTQFTPDGNSYYQKQSGGIVKVDIRTGQATPLVTADQLTPSGGKAITVASFAFNADNNKLLVFTNTGKVWRYKTRGDYWVLDMTTNTLTQLGKGKPAQTMMYAKFSPDSKKVGYVSEHNLFTEEIATGKITQLTFDGTRKLINGTFDWVYEEEFGCRDGFRWSPDGKNIAFWQVDANKIRDYYMLNTTDSNYSQVIPVEYPKVGEAPSPVKIGVVASTGGKVQWMNIEGDPQQHYLPRMEWADAATLVVQQLNRKQQESKLFYCNIADGQARSFFTENDKAWIEVKSYWNDDDPTGWDWIKKGAAFIWVSEKDGWRHIYSISRDGSKQNLITNGKYDIESIKCIDEAGNYIYFMASPNNATQLYLYKVKMDGKSNAIQVSPAGLNGTHSYTISPNAKWANHGFSNYKTMPVKEWVSLPDHKAVNNAASIAATAKTDSSSTVRYTTVTTDDGVELDAWINYPKNFDSTKKYPAVFYVYGEPAATTTGDSYGNHQNFLYNGDMSEDGYFQLAVDNRGTPSLKGSAWRKSIYRKIGTINVRDMAQAATKLIAKSYFDKDRIAVWGWSGGGSSTLNLMFQYPDIFKTGIAIAAVGNQLFYDNIYQERYMGLPQENKEDFIVGSPISYAKNLKGNLLYIHGTGDDNVHYSNAEVLLNELIKYNKQFQFMAYPNRTHSISEGEGTSLHLVTLYTNYLRANCPPGAR
ncbi:DPP IV N-terminal domain-containing protein [Ferruginibacter paludis]|uniref:S9 family peptidase n=1 Tax=Ferruginibacter paludis TaxID=1310417 RepID=UPI0025B4F3E5|nr:DPP IV N-terminal domain-containing protein [Ferruginibacter paludis]MDN3654379.1 DPP IV N-terminal domain-containing protein [Ferruginibacter paludis]